MNKSMRVLHVNSIIAGEPSITFRMLGTLLWLWFAEQHKQAMSTKYCSLDGIRLIEAVLIIHKTNNEMVMNPVTVCLFNFNQPGTSLAPSQHLAP